MIHLLFGPDAYRVRAAYRAIHAELAAADDMLASNTAALDGRTISAAELMAHVAAVPFLASNRMVVVEGLVAGMAQGKSGRRKKGDDDPLEPWRKAAAEIEAGAMPPTTTLILIESDLRNEKKALPAAYGIFGDIAKVEEFTPLDSGAVADWIRTTAAERDVQLAPRAIAALAQLIGPDLWTLSTEIDRLGAYANGETVDPELIAQIVSSAQETKIWALTDAIAEGNATKALVAMRRLITEGQATQLLLFMIVRQMRQLVLVKDMRDRGLRHDDIAYAAGVPKFRVNAVGATASRYSWPALRTAYARLLEADLNVKRNLQDEESSLQLLIHDLCTLAPLAAPRPAARAR